MASDLTLIFLLLLTLLTTTTCFQQQQQQTYSCEKQTKAGGLLPLWDHGNCRQGAAMSVWQRDPHTKKPTGGDEILCDAASDPPGKLTCEARLSTWNSKHVLLAPAPNSDKKTQTLVVVSSNFFFFSFFFPKIFHHNSLNPCWFQIFFVFVFGCHKVFARDRRQAVRVRSLVVSSTESWSLCHWPLLRVATHSRVRFQRLVFSWD